MSAPPSTEVDKSKVTYAHLGKSGLKVSRICLGLMTYGSPEWQKWVLPEKEALPIMKKAWDAGINFYDTANVYSNGESEKILGTFLRTYKIPREKIVIATKCYFQVQPPERMGRGFHVEGLPEIEMANQRGLSRKHIFEAVEASLARIGTDYIDLYQIHRWDYDTPIEETMEALHDLVKLGKVRYIGASSCWAWQFAKAQFVAERHGWTKFVSMQNLYNLVYREEERDMLPLCSDQGVGVIPWSPLARGVLSGQKKDQPTLRQQSDGARRFIETGDKWGDETNEAVLAALSAVATKRGVTMSQVALAWLLAKPVVTAPIVGISKAKYLDDALAAMQLKLTAEEISELEKPYYPKRVVGFT